MKLKKFSMITSTMIGMSVFTSQADTQNSSMEDNIQMLLY